jgi:archaeosine-15-forming tRNA-guanine transglycosylase
MAVMYNLFDSNTGRLIAVCDTEEKIITMAAGLLKANSDAYAQELIVDGETEDGEIVLSLTGDQLLSRVRSVRRERVTAGSSESGDNERVEAIVD